MTTFTQISGALNRAARQAVGAAIGLFIVVYFAYYAIQGDRGLIALRHLENEIEQAQATLEDVRAEREHLARRASLLRPDNLDPDMLEERARLMLNYSHPNDVIIMLPPRSEAPSAVTAQPPTAKP